MTLRLHGETIPREILSESLVVRECSETLADEARRKAERKPVPVVRYVVVVVR